MRHKQTTTKTRGVEDSLHVPTYSRRRTELSRRTYKSSALLQNFIHSPTNRTEFLFSTPFALPRRRLQSQLLLSVQSEPPHTKPMPVDKNGSRAHFGQQTYLSKKTAHLGAHRYRCIYPIAPLKKAHSRSIHRVQIGSFFHNSNAHPPPSSNQEQKTKTF